MILLYNRLLYNRLLYKRFLLYLVYCGGLGLGFVELTLIPKPKYLRFELRLANKMYLQDLDEHLHGDLEEARVLCGGDGHVQVVREVLRGLELRLVLHGDVGEGLKLRRPVFWQIILPLID